MVEGQAIVHKIEHLKTDSDDRPLRDVVIIRSGLKKTKPFYEPSVSYEYKNADTNVNLIECV